MSYVATSQVLSINCSQILEVIYLQCLSGSLDNQHVERRHFNMWARLDLSPRDVFRVVFQLSYRFRTQVPARTCVLILSSMFFGRREGGGGGLRRRAAGDGGGGRVLSGVGTYSLRLFDTLPAGCLETVDT